MVTKAWRYHLGILSLCIFNVHIVSLQEGTFWVILSPSLFSLLYLSLQFCEQGNLHLLPFNLLFLDCGLSCLLIPCKHLCGLVEGKKSPKLPKGLNLGSAYHKILKIIVLAWDTAWHGVYGNGSPWLYWHKFLLLNMKTDAGCHP